MVNTFMSSIEPRPHRVVVVTAAPLGRHTFLTRILAHVDSKSRGAILIIPQEEDADPSLCVLCGKRKRLPGDEFDPKVVFASICDLCRGWD